MLSGSNRTLGGILLVSGTTIGAGMLALPISTGLAGFFPSLVLFVLFWALMTYTAFLLLEVNLWLPEEPNMITMATQTLGTFGKIMTGTLYLLLLYCLTTAYLALSGPLFLDFTHVITGVSLPSWIGPLPLILLFSYFVFKGTEAVDGLNRYLMFGMVVAFIFIIAALAPHVEYEYLSRWEPIALPLAVSLVATSFGFHIIIPTLTTYLKHDGNKLIRVLIIGGAIPLFIYVLWLFLTLGIIPIEGKFGIFRAFVEGTNSTLLLTEVLSSHTVNMVIRFFSLFAIVTSFLGVSLSLWDFLSDAFNQMKVSPSRLKLYALTFIPPLLLTLIRPRIVFDALEVAGAFGVVTLLAILPALMVWRGRYHLNMSSDSFRAPGGKPALILVIIISVVIISIELALKSGLMSTILNALPAN